jgi:hypothetical protein
MNKPRHVKIDFDDDILRWVETGSPVLCPCAAAPTTREQQFRRCRRDCAAFEIVECGAVVLPLATGGSDLRLAHTLVWCKLMGDSIGILQPDESPKEG